VVSSGDSVQVTIARAPVHEIVCFEV